MGCNIDVVDNTNNDNDHNGKAYIHHHYLWVEFVILSETTGKSLKALCFILSYNKYHLLPGPHVNMLPVQPLNNFVLFITLIAL